MTVSVLASVECAFVSILEFRLYIEFSFKIQKLRCAKFSEKIQNSASVECALVQYAKFRMYGQCMAHVWPITGKLLT